MGNNYLSMLLQFAGGLGLFIYGMHVMAAGLQKSAGGRMKRLLEVLTKNKLMGVFVGAGVTAIIHSSTATTVMIVGFVNAGLMNLTQAIGVIMGANVGTTITSLIVAGDEWLKFLEPETFAPIAIAIGAVMIYFVSNTKIKQVGEIIAGLGILFIGMEFMTEAVSPLREVQVFRDILVNFGSNPLLGLLAGTVITGIIQSSTASVGILQALAVSGLIPWNAAIYIIMGQNIGTCFTALLSSMGTTKNARSAAYIHLLFNVIGSVVFTVAAIVFFSVINPDLGKVMISKGQISLVHTWTNIISIFMLYPFSNQIIRLSEKLGSIGKFELDVSEPVHLDDRILATPAFAIDNCIKEIVRMAEIALENLKLSTQALIEKNGEKIEKVLKREKSIDALDASITQYLVKICNEDITEDENAVITALFHTVNDVERVGDHCENISELAQYAITENINFSEDAIKELEEISGMTILCFENSIKALQKSDKGFAKKVVEQEDNIDTVEEAFRAAHIKRLSTKECTSENGVAYLDALTNLERVSDHSLNIAQFVLNQKNITKKN